MRDTGEEGERDGRREEGGRTGGREGRKKGVKEGEGGGRWKEEEAELELVEGERRGGSDK